MVEAVQVQLASSIGTWSCAENEAPSLSMCEQMIVDLDLIWCNYDCFPFCFRLLTFIFGIFRLLTFIFHSLQIALAASASPPPMLRAGLLPLPCHFLQTASPQSSLSFPSFLLLSLCRVSASSLSFLAATCLRLESLELGTLAQGGLEPWGCNRRSIQIAVPKVGWVTGKGEE